MKKVTNGSEGMSSHEEEFETKEIQKQRRNKNKKRVRSAALVLLGIVIGIIGYMMYMNLEPFTDGEKVAGIPDDYIKVVKQSDDSLAPLFLASAKYDYNTSGKTISIYVDYYEKEVQKKHDLVLNVDQMDEGPLAGTIYSGLTSTEELGDFQDLLVTINSNKAKYTGNYSFEEINLNTENGLLFTENAFEDGKVTKGKKYVMQAWSTGQKIYNNEKDLFSNKFLKESPQTVLFYFIIE